MFSMSHPAFKVFDSEQGDQNGFPSTVYQVSVTNAVDQKKVSVEKRKMPDFKNNDEAELYFKVSSSSTNKSVKYSITPYIITQIIGASKIDKRKIGLNSHNCTQTHNPKQKMRQNNEEIEWS